MAAIELSAVSRIALVVVNVLAAGVASLTGFGIGSLLIPLLALWIETKSVHLARIPVSPLGDHRTLVSLSPVALLMTGVLLRSYLRQPVLKRLPGAGFRPVRSMALLLLGRAMLFAVGPQP